MSAVMSKDQTESIWLALRDEKAWGPWQSTTPPVGSVFRMRLTPRDLSSNTFRLVNIVDGRMKLDMMYNGHWEVGTHGWSLNEKPSFSMFLEGGCSGGCVCEKCQTPNEFAAPNRPGGKYLCYDCRWQFPQ